LYFFACVDDTVASLVVICSTHRTWTVALPCIDPSFVAVTRVRVDTVHTLPIPTILPSTVVYIGLARVSLPPSIAHAQNVVGKRCLQAGPVSVARVRLAVVNRVIFTVVSGKPVVALALVALPLPEGINGDQVVHACAAK
jgi:hypothetical protein